MRAALISYCRSEGVYREALARAADLVLVVTSGDPRAAEERISHLGVDVVFVAGCPVKLPASLFGAARLGTVNFHPSLLPAYRGRDPVFWTLLAGEKTTGVTAHRMTGDIDAGPVLLQAQVAIADRADSDSLSRELDVAGAALIPELCELADRGALPEGSPQTGAASYFPPVRAADGRIDWKRDAHAVDRLVRACAGEIHAHTTWRGMKLVVLAARPVEGDASANAGAVLGVDEGGVRVATASGSVILERFLFVDRTWSARELAEQLGLSPGLRFDES